ncbi:MAG: multicopper oxidase domain-containing protein [Acidobacteria bacterium]|nr:multicopper oxidase domain-containing protein [Acidobacteriota bacterium]
MIRRRFLALSCGWISSAAIAIAQHERPASSQLSNLSPQPTDEADIKLRIGAVTLELAPKRSIKTIAYNGQVPGPILSARLGKPVTVDVWNDTNDEDLVHWHGFHIPPDVDGSIEEGTPPVPPNGGRRRYAFTPGPAGTRWYHSHAMAGRNLKKGTYTGQFGLFVVEADGDPGAYDQEVPILLHEWEPRFTEQGALDVAFRYFSINGKMLGAGEPIRVQPSQRVLFRIVNASATLQHRLALPGHTFQVTALDGNPVPVPRHVPILEIGPGERVDAIVEMNRPGVWILGEVRTDWRTAGMGIAIEYAGQQGPPQWGRIGPFVWDYGLFGGTDTVPEPDERLTLVIRPTSDGHHWTINGKSYPRTAPIVVRANRRYRWILDNQSADNHPIHLHRHTFSWH